MKLNFEAAKLVKDMVRAPYAWPGGYEKIAITNDCAVLCGDCVKDEIKTILRSTLTNAKDGWGIEGIDVNWEDQDLYCDHCGERLIAEYE